MANRNDFSHRFSMPVRQLAALLILSSACSNSTVAEAGGPAQLAEVYCTRLLACCQGQPGLPSLSVCVSTYSATLAGQLSDPDTEYDAIAAAKCIADLEADPCESLALDVMDVDPNCVGVVRGTLPLGAQCSKGGDCSTGLCAGIAAEPQTGAMLGACATPLAANASCDVGPSDGALCATGTFPQQGSGTVCTCTPLLSNGASCDNPSQCQSGDCAGSEPGGCPLADVCGSPQCSPLPTTMSLSAGSCQALVQSL